MTSSEINILAKGLKFTPTPDRPNKQELHEDVLEFTRKLRLIEYFEGTENNDPSVVQNKSDFIPSKGRDSDLEEYISTITKIPNTSSDKKRIKHNLTKAEREAMLKLAKDNNTVIKEADKGGATVTMDSNYYKDKIEDMLSDSEYYSKLSSNPQKEIVQAYNKLIKKT